MKTYNVFELSVVNKVRENNTYQYFICRRNGISGSFIEIFTETEIEVDAESLVEPLKIYYPVLSVCNYKTGEPLMLTMEDLLNKYNDINYINCLLGLDEETIEYELKRRGIFEESRVYSKRHSTVN